MTIALDLIAAAAACWTLLQRVSLPRGLRLALIALATTAVFSCAGMAELLFGLPAWLIQLLFIATAAAAKFRPAASTTEWPASASRTWMFVFGAAAVVAFVCMVEHVHRMPDGGADAYIIWTLRARWMYRAKAAFATAFSPDILFWTHQDYPLMLPGLIYRFFEIFGESLVIPAAVAIGFAALTVALISSASRFGVFAGLALLTTPNLVILTATEQADIPLAAFVAASIAVLIAPGTRDLRRIAAAGAFAAMAAWTKNEGNLLFVLIGLAVLLDDRRFRTGAAYLAGAAPFLALLIAFKLKYATGNDLLQSNLSAMAHRLTDPARLWTIVRLALRHLVLLQVWGLQLAAALVVLLLTRKTAARTWVALVPAVALLTYIPIYLGQPHDVGYMVQVTLDRLVMQVWPAILVVLARKDIQPVIVNPHAEVPSAIGARIDG